METDLMIQLTIEEKANLENLEGAIKRELGSFIVVGRALEEIRAKGLYRDGYKTFHDYCNQKWDMGKSQSSRLIIGSQVAINLSPAGDRLTPCETQPTSERQVRPLAVLEPNEQSDVWEVAVKTARLARSGGFPDETAETALLPSGLESGRRWPGAVAASGMGLADPWVRGKVTPPSLLG